MGGINRNRRMAGSERKSKWWRRHGGEKEKLVKNVIDEERHQKNEIGDIDEISNERRRHERNNIEIGVNQ